MVAVNDKPLMHFESAEAFAAFLESDPPDHGIRVQLMKKGDERPGIDWKQAVDVALLLAGSTARRPARSMATAWSSFPPRRTRSPWSQINIGEHRAAHRRGTDARGRPRRDRAGQGRRQVGAPRTG